MTSAQSDREALHCAGCTGVDHLGRPCRGRQVQPSAVVVNVERLAKALTKAPVVPDAETADRDAAAIAREYRALALAGSQPEPGSGS